MASGDSFKQVIEVAIEATTDPNIKSLLQDLRTLGESGELTDEQLGQLGAGVQALSKELGALKDAATQARVLEQLTKDAGDTAEAFDQASRVALALKLQLGSVAEPTREMERAFREAAKEVRRLDELQSKQQATIAGVGDELRAAGVDTDQLAAAQVRLTEASERTVAALGEQVTAAKQAAAEQAAATAQQLEAARELAEAQVAAAQEVAAAQAAAIAQQLEAARKLAETAERRAVQDREFIANMDAQFAASRDAAEVAGQLAQANLTSADALETYGRGAGKAAEETAGLRDEAAATSGVLDKLKGVAAGVFAFFSVSKAVDGIKAILTGASDAEQSLGQLDAALESTGRQAEFSAGQLASMVAELRNTSTFSDDQIVSAQTRLLTYTNIVGKEFPEALQISIDQAARLGISVESSAEIIGKALQSPSKAMEGLAKQGFVLEAGQKELLQQLEATGRTAEAQAIIMGLLTESYGGAAAAQRLGTAKGLWKGLSDQIADFQALIADAGVFDFFKGRLAALSEQVKQLAADGTLLQYARNIAGAITSTAKAIEGAITFVVQYSGALLELARIYAAFQFARFLTGIASTATAMLGAAAAARTTAASMGGLRAAILALPITWAFTALVIGADVAIRGIQGISNALKEQRDADRDLVNAQAVRLRLQETLNERVKVALEELQKYKDVVIKTRDEIGAADERELKSYGFRLQAARDYYAAVEQAARTAGDAAGMAAAAAKVAELGGALGELQERYRQLKIAAEEALNPSSNLDAALKELGVGAQNLGVKFTEAGTKALSAFATIATDGKASADQVGEAYTRALAKLSTTTEIDALGQALKVAFDKGLVSAEQYAAGMAAATERTKSLTDASAQAALKIGSIGDASREASLEVIRGWEAARAAIAGTADAIGRSIANAIKQGVDQGSDEFKRLVAAGAEADAELKRLTDQINAGRKALQDAGSGAEELAGGLDRVTDSANGAGEGITAAGESADQAGSKVAGIVGLLQKLKAEFDAVSPAAGQAFVDAQRGTVDWAISLQDVERRIYRVADAIRAQIGAQSDALEGALSTYRDFADGVNDAGFAVNRMVDTGIDGLANLADQVRQGRGGFELLNQADLDRLGSELDRAAARVAKIAAEAESAKAALEGIADGLQDAADRRAGNDQAILARQYEQQVERINALAQAGGAVARQEADRARALAEREYLTQLAEVQARQQQQQQSATAVANTQIAEAQRAADAVAAIRRDASQGPNAPAAQQGGVMRIEVIVRNEQRPGGILSELTDRDLDQLAQRLLALIAQQRSFG